VLSDQMHRAWFATFLLIGGRRKRQTSALDANLILLTEGSKTTWGIWSDNASGLLCQMALPFGRVSGSSVAY
jgi:hypothetical protein